MNEAASLWGAFAAGLVTSVHCAGMCGLLTCGLGIAGGENQAARITGYHAGRLASYTLVGMLAGLAGWGPAAWLGGAGAFVPWFLVLFLVAMGLGWERFLPAIPGVSRLIYPLRRRFARLTGARQGVAVGFLTPLLPCGPLWAMFALGMLSGSPARGGELLLVFGLGTVPLLWLMQSGSSWWQRRLSPLALQRIRQGVALLAAAVLAWRFRGGLPFLDGPAGCGCELAGL